MYAHYGSTVANNSPGHLVKMLGYHWLYHWRSYQLRMWAN